MEVPPRLEQIRSHLTVVLNDLVLARSLLVRDANPELDALVDEALAHTERLSDLSRDR